MGMTYSDACIVACDRSAIYNCVQHVNRELREMVKPGESAIYYTVSDWYDYTKTVKSYENGREL